MAVRASYAAEQSRADQTKPEKGIAWPGLRRLEVPLGRRRDFCPMSWADEVTSAGCTGSCLRGRLQWPLITVAVCSALWCLRRASVVVELAYRGTTTRTMRVGFKALLRSAPYLFPLHPHSKMMAVPPADITHVEKKNQRSGPTARATDSNLLPFHDNGQSSLVALSPWNAIMEDPALALTKHAPDDTSWQSAATFTQTQPHVTPDPFLPVYFIASFASRHVHLPNLSALTARTTATSYRTTIMTIFHNRPGNASVLTMSRLPYTLPDRLTRSTRGPCVLAPRNTHRKFYG
ncbi:hypothetical protein IWX49DRAFT_352974 [Phyllosticta citricarpa]|uniref:Uncharacterized protein n=2 Tax=Phyllosticta TaxID=121621 RepID=A0ABR1L7N4_9PEZI